MNWEYLIWASTIKNWDYCEIEAYLTAKKKPKSIIDSETAFNFLKHDAYEETYLKKWDVIKNKEKITAEELKDYTLSKIDDVVLKKWDRTIWPALQIDSKKMRREEYTEIFKDEIEKNLDKICENVVKNINNKTKEIEFNYIAECKDWDLLKDLDYGIGARPDLIIGMGTSNLRIVDIKNVKEEYMRGIQLQNAAGYLVVKKNKDGLARKLNMNPEKVGVDRVTIFEDYNTGNEIIYRIKDEDIQEVIDIASSIRCKKIPSKHQVCYENKESKCVVKDVCIKLFGNVADNFEF